MIRKKGKEKIERDERKKESVNEKKERQMKKI